MLEDKQNRSFCFAFFTTKNKQKCNFPTKNTNQNALSFVKCQKEAKNSSRPFLFFHSFFVRL